MADVETLIQQLYSDEKTARWVKTRLLDIGSPAVEPLCDVLHGRNQIPDLSHRKSGGFFSELLKVFEAPPNGDQLKIKTRATAAALLGTIGDTRAVEPLLSASSVETQDSVRVAIVRALCQLGRKS